jgi:predicted acylesterase/phospholipase RssA
VWGFLTTGFLWALERKGIRFYTVGGSSVGSIITAALASTGPIEQPKMDNLLAGLLHNLNFETVASLDDAVEPTAEDARKYGVPLDELRTRWRQAAHMALFAHNSLMASSNSDPDLSASSASTSASAAATRAAALAAQSHAAILGSMAPGSLFAPPPAPRSSVASLGTATPRGSSDASSSDSSLCESESDEDVDAAGEQSRRAPGFFGRYKAKVNAARKVISYLTLYRRRKKNLKDLSAIMNEHGGILSGQALGRVVDITLMDCRRRQCCISLRRAVPSLHGFVSPYLGATPLPSTDLTASLPEELLLCLAQPTSALAELDHILTENTNALYDAGAKLQLARQRAQPFLLPGPKVRGRGSAPNMGLEGGKRHRPLPRRSSAPAATVAGHATASDANRHTDTRAPAALSELARCESEVEELLKERYRLVSCVNHRNGMLLDTTSENVVQRLADSAARLPLRHRALGTRFSICTDMEGVRDVEQLQAKAPAGVPLQPPRLRMVALEARSGARMVFPEHAPAIATDARLVPLSEYVRASSAVPIIYAAHRHLHRFAFSLPLSGDTILHAVGLAAEAAMTSANLAAQDCDGPPMLPQRPSVARFFTAVRGTRRHQSSPGREEPHAEAPGQITPPRTGMFGRRLSHASASPSRAARQLFSAVSGSPGAQSVGRAGGPPSPPRGNGQAGPGEPVMSGTEDSTWGKAVLQVPFAGLTPAEMEAADLVSAAHLEAYKRNGGPVSVTHNDMSIAQLWAPMRTRPSAAATFRCSDAADIVSDSAMPQGTKMRARKLQAASCSALDGPMEGAKAETAALPDDFELFQQRVTAAAIHAGAQAASVRCKDGEQGGALPGNVSRSALSAVRTLISKRQAGKITEVAPESDRPGDSCGAAAAAARKSSSRHVDWEAVQRLHPDNAVHRLAASRKPPAQKSAAVSSVSMNYHGPAPDKVRLVDGGVISNFPFDLFHEAHNGPPPMPSIGFRVGVKRRRLFQFNTFLSFTWSCLQGLRQYGDGLLFSRLAVDDTNVREVEEPENIAFSKFNLSIEEQMIMFNIGVDEALRFLYHNPDVSSNVDAAPKGAFDWECYKKQVTRAWRMPGPAMPGVANATAESPFRSGRKVPRKVFEGQKATFV